MKPLQTTMLLSSTQQDYYKEWEAKTAELMSAPYSYVRQSDFPSSDGVKFLKRAVGA